MNLVFFDSDRGLPYADCVALNNERAVSTLYQALKEAGYKRIIYVGWDMTEIYSIRMREEAYRTYAGEHGIVLRIDRPGGSGQKSLFLGIYRTISSIC